MTHGPGVQTTADDPSRYRDEVERLYAGHPAPDARIQRFLDHVGGAFSRDDGAGARPS